MKIRNAGSNMTEVTTKTEGGLEVTVLFSYETPVACHSEVTMKFYRTEKKWSATTTRHINKWLREQGQPTNVETKPQEFFHDVSAMQSRCESDLYYAFRHLSIIEDATK